MQPEDALGRALGRRHPYRGVVEVLPAEAAHPHRGERGAARGVPARRGAERARARGLPADRGAEGPGGRRSQLRARAPRGLLRAGLRRVRDRGLPGLPGLLLRAPAHRPRGARDAGNRRDLARTADPRLLHVDLRRPHGGGDGRLRGRRALPARCRLPDRAGARRRDPARERSGRCACVPPTWRARWPATAASASVLDLVPVQVGVSGRVVELRVVGSEGQLDLRGQRVRLGLGLRESLFVLHRETGAEGAIERFVITGQGLGPRRGPVPGRRVRHGAGGRVVRADPEALLHGHRRAATLDPPVFDTRAGAS